MLLGVESIRRERSGTEGVCQIWRKIFLVGNDAVNSLGLKDREKKDREVREGI